MLQSNPMSMFTPMVGVWTVCIGAMIVFCGVSAPLQGQPRTPVEATEAQGLLNKQGLQAHNAGDYTRAAELFRAALAVGELNLLYLNLGRALQKAGSCREAQEALRTAFKAPPVKGVSTERIEAEATKFLNELKVTCPGTLVVQCTPAELDLTVDGTPQPCATPLRLEPGVHMVVGTYQDQRREQKVGIIALEETLIQVSVELPVVKPPVEADTPHTSRDSINLPAWILVGTGGALMVSGGVFSLLTAQTNNDIDALSQDAASGPIDGNEANTLLDQADRYQRLQWVGYGVGAALVTGGALLFVFDSPSQEADLQPTTTGVAPWLGPDSAGIVWETSY